jgi:dihydrofolate reductase
MSPRGPDVSTGAARSRTEGHGQEAGRWRSGCWRLAVTKGNTTFEFVTDGAAAAVARARAAAGDRDVLVMGGANLTGQYLDAGEVDELTVTVAPVLLGAGKRFFDRALRPDLTLEPAGVIESPFVTHLRYRCSVKE